MARKNQSGSAPRTDKRRKPAGSAAALLFGALMLGLVLAITALVGVTAHRSSTEAIDELWAESANQLLARVVLHVDSIFEPAKHFGRYSAGAHKAGRLDPTDHDALFDHLEAAIDAFPTIVWVSFATHDAQYLSVYRWPTEDGGWEIRRTHRILLADAAEPHTWFREWRRDASRNWVSIRDEHAGLYDPRVKPWWQAGRQGDPDEEHWSGPLLFFSRKQLGVVYSRAAHDLETRDFLGVWAAEFEAAPIVDYLAALEAVEGTDVYVIHDDGTIIARPSGALVGPEGLLTAAKADDPVLSAVWEGMQSGSAVENVPFPLDKHIAMYRRMPDASGLPWRVIVSIPKETLFQETRDQSRFAAVVGGIGVLLSLVLMAFAATTLNRVIRSTVASAVAATKVGQYTLEAKIGSGGMGDVYRASHSMLRRPTAVKLLQSDSSSALDIQRFEREVQLTCKLTHPNTITIFDYGSTPDGRFYYAMELIDGATLLELVRFTGPMPPGRVIYIAEQVCGALAEAHDSGLVHRDIKPANILVAELGGRGDFVKVVDFGLVREVEPGEQGITQDGSFAGTPGFLAPEVPMNPNAVAPVIDIYSLGSVMYVMLTAQMPYDGNSGMAVFVSQQTEDPVLPSEKLGQPLPEDLERLVMACLDRDPANRPQTAEQLRERLLRCADASAWSEEDANSWWQRHGPAVREAVATDDAPAENTTLIAENHFDVT